MMKATLAVAVFRGRRATSIGRDRNPPVALLMHVLPALGPLKQVPACDLKLYALVDAPQHRRDVDKKMSVRLEESAVSEKKDVTTEEDSAIENDVVIEKDAASIIDAANEKDLVNEKPGGHEPEVMTRRYNLIGPGLSPEAGPLREIVEASHLVPQDHDTMASLWIL
jgi:hypothetical protein